MKQEQWVMHSWISEQEFLQPHPRFVLASPSCFSEVSFFRCPPHTIILFVMRFQPFPFCTPISALAQFFCPLLTAQETTRRTAWTTARGSASAPASASVPFFSFWWLHICQSSFLFSLLYLIVLNLYHFNTIKCHFDSISSSLQIISALAQFYSILSFLHTAYCKPANFHSNNSTQRQIPQFSNLRVCTVPYLYILSKDILWQRRKTTDCTD